MKGLKADKKYSAISLFRTTYIVSSSQKEGTEIESSENWFKALTAALSFFPSFTLGCFWDSGDKSMCVLVLILFVVWILDDWVGGYLN